MFDFNVKYDAFKIDHDNTVYGLTNGRWVKLIDSQDDREWSIGKMRYFQLLQCSFDCKIFDENDKEII